MARMHSGSITQTNPFGCTSNRCAVVSNQIHPPLAKFLIGKDADPNLLVTRGDYHTILTGAVKGGSLGIVMFLVENCAGANWDLSLQTWSQWHSDAIAKAQRHRQNDILQYLKENVALDLVESADPQRVS